MNGQSEENHKDSLLTLLKHIDQKQREKGVEPLSEEEAMRLANEELHAMRRDRGKSLKRRYYEEQRGEKRDSPESPGPRD
jgi:chromatin segregation and condensation protein Rec8/ScpA/Scc1 (kleisin family)